MPRWGTPTGRCVDLRRYAQLCADHYKNAVLQFVPEQMRGMEDAAPGATSGDPRGGMGTSVYSPVSTPNLDAPVFVYCREDGGVLRLPEYVLLAYPVKNLRCLRAARSICCATAVYAHSCNSAVSNFYSIYCTSPSSRTTGSGRLEKSSFFRTMVTTWYEVTVAGLCHRPDGSGPCGEEKSGKRSASGTVRSGIGLLLHGAAWLRTGVTGGSFALARLRTGVGEEGCHAPGLCGDDRSVCSGIVSSSSSSAGCTFFSNTASGFRSWTSVPSNRWCEIWRIGRSCVSRRTYLAASGELQHTNGLPPFAIDALHLQRPLQLYQDKLAIRRELHQRRRHLSHARLRSVPRMDLDAHRRRRRVAGGALT